MTTKQTQYAQERLDPRWQKKRLEIMQRDDFKCRDCEDSTATLNVHHAYYVTGRKCWNYPSFSLETLCWECHKQRHEPPPEEEEEHHTEWETVLDWITDGKPEQSGAFWFVAAEIKQSLDMIDHLVLFGQIEKFIHSLREKAHAEAAK